jgi:hypothetical protein
MSNKQVETRPNWVRNTALAEHFKVSAMCIWRWKRDASLGCPPTYEVNGKEWNDLNAWDAWMQGRVISHIDKTKEKAAAG